MSPSFNINFATPLFYKALTQIPFTRLLAEGAFRYICPLGNNKNVS